MTKTKIVTNDNYKNIKNYLSSSHINKHNKILLDFKKVHPISVGFINLIPLLYKIKHYDTERWSKIELVNIDPKYFQVSNLELPRFLDLEPTARCNLKCPYCPVSFVKTAPRKDLSFSNFIKIIDNYKIAPEINLWGYGEPLLNKDIFKMVKYSKKKGCINCTISTNCYYISDSMFPKFFTSRLDKLILSLDGASNNTYLKHRQGSDFKKVLKNIFQLCKYKKNKGFKNPEIILQFIVTSYNEHEIPKIKLLSKKLGVDSLFIKTISANNEQSHFLPKNIKYSRNEHGFQKSEWCNALWDRAGISSEGEITFCCKTLQNIDNFSLGNILDNDFESIWNGKNYQYYRKFMLEGNKDLIEHCDPTCPAGQKVIADSII